ncbi:MAG: hypothetical protein SFW36_01545 [Leptolyngbyaceae cyanobacterium bins.59]|nr:hypothetical protein [Leptolyngbyaceae cyanobacterium bins.59]
MTASTDFGDDRQDFGAPAYPSAFGITFTPTILGAILAVVGLAGAAFIVVQLVLPELSRNETLKGEVGGLEQQVAQAAGNPQKVVAAKAELEDAKRRRAEVQDLFADETSLNTLLLDISREFRQPGRRIQLLGFNPSGPPVPLSDPNLPPGVQGKLKSQTIGISMRGSFAQTQAVIRNIERLQPLILVRNFSTTKDGSGQVLVIDNATGRSTPTGEVLLNTNLSLQVIVSPVNPPAPPPGAAPPPAPPK